jgi:hypothetical protein
MPEHKLPDGVQGAIVSDGEKHACPCGLAFYIVSDELGPVGLVHEVPHCQKFEQLDVTSFLQWINQKGLVS